MGRGTTLASAPLEIGGADYGATKRVNVCRSMWRGRVRAVTATGALGGAPYGATKRVRGVPKWARWCHAVAPIETVVGAL